MKVKVLQSFAGSDIHGVPNQVLDVEEIIGKDLISAGYVEPVEEAEQPAPKRTTRKRKAKE